MYAAPLSPDTSAVILATTLSPSVPFIDHSALRTGASFMSAFGTDYAVCNTETHAGAIAGWHGGESDHWTDKGPDATFLSLDDDGTDSFSFLPLVAPSHPTSLRNAECSAGSFSDPV